LVQLLLLLLHQLCVLLLPKLRPHNERQPKNQVQL